MAGGTEKLQKSITGAPLGALVGGFLGYLLSKELGYDKTLSVIGFTMTRLIIGSAIGASIKK